MADLEHTDHHTDAAGSPVDLFWRGEFWEVFVDSARIGTLAESYPAIGETETHYVAKLEGEENIADGFVSTSPEQAIALLIEAAGA